MKFHLNTFACTHNCPSGTLIPFNMTDCMKKCWYIYHNNFRVNYTLIPYKFLKLHIYSSAFKVHTLLPYN